MADVKMVNLTIEGRQVTVPEGTSIIEAAKTDPNRFAPLYNKYYKQIFNYVYQRMDSKDAAFDVTGQVFLKALHDRMRLPAVRALVVAVLDQRHRRRRRPLDVISGGNGHREPQSLEYRHEA